MPDVYDIELQLLLEAIYLRYRYDFRSYSMASVKRRVARAMDEFQCKSISALQERVLHDTQVFPQMLQYLTVQVSDMFRDPPFFKTLRERIVPFLKTYPSQKIWVAGCSSGEAVYSRAILRRAEGLAERTMISATDITGEALRRAEAGVYPLERLPAFTENHRLAGGHGSLSSYYTAAYGSAVFDRSLLKRVVFSDHSLATDHVFAEVQLISCRNVLIYFDRTLQDRALGLFKEALVRRGFLGLGSKESMHASAHRPAFQDFSPNDRWYQRS
ncbi:MAG: chemotaxis protein CheR [Myxococcaceae bacterium]|nr:chemotaxis protein CheR [Myxococcaceae bacterium]